MKAKKKQTDDKISLTFASKLLDKSEKTIRSYIKKGLLSEYKEGKESFVSKKELLSLFLQWNKGSYTELDNTYFIEDDNERRDRLLYLLKADSESIMEKLEMRKDELCKLWSRERLRQPFLNTLKSKYNDISIETLLSLNVTELTAFREFYDELDRLVWYLEYTQDMPKTLEKFLTRSINTLREKYRTLRKVLNKNEEE